MGAKQKAPGETAGERAYADIGVDRMEMTRQMRPIRKDFFKRVQDFRKRSANMRGQSATDFAIASQPVKERASNTGQAGRAAVVGLDLAGAGADAAAATERRINKTSTAGLQGLAEMAVGEQGTAIAGMGELAKQSQDDAFTRSRAAAARRGANAQLIAGGIGAVAGGLSKSGAPVETVASTKPGVTPLTNPNMPANFSERTLTRPSMFDGSVPKDPFGIGY